MNFFCVVFACFHTFIGLNYVLYCCVSAGMFVFAVCSLFAVPFVFLLEALFVRFYGVLLRSQHAPCVHP